MPQLLRALPVGPLIAPLGIAFPARGDVGPVGPQHGDSFHSTDATDATPLEHTGVRGTNPCAVRNPSIIPKLNY